MSLYPIVSSVNFDQLVKVGLPGFSSINKVTI